MKYLLALEEVFTSLHYYRSW